MQNLKPCISPSTLLTSHKPAQQVFKRLFQGTIDLSTELEGYLVTIVFTEIINLKNIFCDFQLKW